MRHKYLSLWLGLLLIALSIGGPAAHAATITVNTTADSLATNGACSLREALRNANFNSQASADCVAGQPGNDLILVQPGTIKLTIGGTNENNGLTGDLDITDDVTITGFGPGVTFVDGLGSDRVFHVVNSSQVQIDNLTISGGASSQGGGVRMGNGSTVFLWRVDVRDNTSTLIGGGVANVGGELEVAEAFFGFNSASTTGGAIHTTGPTVISGSLLQENDASTGGGVYSVSGALTVSSTDFRQNTATTAGGGLATVNNGLTRITGGTFFLNEGPGGAAMQFNAPWELTGAVVRDNTSPVGGGAIRSRSDATVEQATFLRNTGINGGAILHEVGTLEVTNSLFDDNSATSGGAIDNRATANLTDCEILANAASASGGGITNTGRLFLLRSTLDRNTAAVDGGGLFDNGGDSTIQYTAVTANVADGDGGGVMIRTFGSEVELYNTTVSANVALGRGGGVFVGGSFSFDFTTLANNRALGGLGGAIFLDAGTIDLKNSIISNHTPANCGGSGPGAGIVTSAGYNISDDGSCMLSGPSDSNNVNPELKSLQNNGGPTATHALATTSPARDTAAPNCARFGGVAWNDQRVITRPLEGDGIPGAECDRGAFEGGNPFSIQPKPVGDGIIGSPLRASRNDSFGTDAADIQWDVSTCISQDYHVLYGNLSQLSGYVVSGAVCDLGPGIGSTTIGLPAGDLWFLVIGDDDFDIEGSWGTATAGERNGSTVSGECSMAIRDNAAACP